MKIAIRNCLPSILNVSLLSQEAYHMIYLILSFQLPFIITGLLGRGSTIYQSWNISSSKDIDIERLKCMICRSILFMIWEKIPNIWQADLRAKQQHVGNKIIANVLTKKIRFAVHCLLLTLISKFYSGPEFRSHYSDCPVICI